MAAIKPGPKGPDDVTALEAFHMYTVGRLSTYKVAQQLGVPQSTVRDWIDRGRELDFGVDQLPGKERRRKAAQTIQAILEGLAQDLTLDLQTGRVTQREQAYQVLRGVVADLARVTDAYPTPRRRKVDVQTSGTGGGYALSPEQAATLQATFAADDETKDE